MVYTPLMLDELGWWWWDDKCPYTRTAGVRAGRKQRWERPPEVPPAHLAVVQ